MKKILLTSSLILGCLANYNTANASLVTDMSKLGDSQKQLLNLNKEKQVDDAQVIFKLPEGYTFDLENNIDGNCEINIQSDYTASVNCGVGQDNKAKIFIINQNGQQVSYTELRTSSSEVFVALRNNDTLPYNCRYPTLSYQDCVAGTDQYLDIDFGTNPLIYNILKVEE